MNKIYHLAPESKVARVITRLDSPTYPMLRSHPGMSANSVIPGNVNGGIMNMLPARVSISPLMGLFSLRESLNCQFVCLELSPATQNEDQFTAATPRQTLPELGLAIAGNLETATRAFEAPTKLEHILADLQLQTAAPVLRRSRRRLGRQGRVVEGGDLLPGQSFAGPGPSQQRGSFGHVPPCLGSHRSGSGSRCYANVHGPAFRAFRTVFLVDLKEPCDLPPRRASVLHAPGQLHLVVG